MQFCHKLITRLVLLPMLAMLGAQTSTGEETVETQALTSGSTVNYLQYLPEGYTSAQQPQPYPLFCFCMELVKASTTCPK